MAPCEWTCGLEGSPETQATYGSPEGTWGPASSEVAARAHGVTYGHHIGVGGGLASRDAARAGAAI